MAPSNIPKRALLDALRSRGYLLLLLAGVTQLVECQLPKLNVAGSSPVARSALEHPTALSLLKAALPR
jgi:hypothetical protein